ncbi:hypothetical protein ACFL1N_14765 [Thermodesulfobacteriota bacterium]
MSYFFYLYISLWALACLFAVLIYIINKESFTNICKGYWQFLFKHWKVVTFIIATGGLVLVAPYTGDPTWDYTDALFMSILTYLTAPWVIGIIYKFIKGDLAFKYAYVAFCTWLFSASWSYDLYILIRDGYYPVTWFSNIFASSVLYILAGLFWNLDWRKGRGVIFSFMLDDWFTSSTYIVFQKVLLFAFPIMALVSFLIFFFFLI